MSAIEAFRNFFQRGGDRRSSDSRYKQGPNIGSNTRPEGLPGLVVKPLNEGTLEARLVRALEGFSGKEEEARLRRIRSTDLIRGQKLERYKRHKIDTLTQIQLIHKIHMGGNEEYLLKEDQAIWVKSMRPKVDRIAGVIRSEKEIPQNIGLGSSLTPCVSFKRTPELLDKLVKKTDELFPPDGLNPKVNKDSIYHYLSAFQYGLVLIHPFLEANARTSEDAMYIFWHRRPDLYPVHYVSNDGQRESKSGFDRESIIREGAREILLQLARKFGLSYGELQSIQRYPDLLRVMHNKHGIEADELEVRYINMFDRAVESFVESMDDIESLKSNPAVNAMAVNLAASHTEYHFTFSPLKNP